MFKKLVFEICGWPADREKAEACMNGDDIVIKTTKSNVVVSTAKKVTVTAADFLKKLEAINIVAWEDNYCDYNILDGESWELKYYTTDGKIKKVTGSNAYPGNYDELINLLFDDGTDVCENV